MVFIIKLIDYYKKNLDKEVIDVKSIYLNPNLVPDDFPYYAETYNIVKFKDGTINYFMHPYEFEHTLIPLEMHPEWLFCAVCCDNEDLDEELEDCSYEAIS